MGHPRVGSNTSLNPITSLSEPNHISTKDRSEVAGEKDYFDHVAQAKSDASYQARLARLAQNFCIAETPGQFIHIYRDLFSILFKDSSPLAQKSARATLKFFVAETSKEHFTQSMAKLMAAGIALNYPDPLEHQKEIETFVDSHFTDGLEEAGKEVKVMLDTQVYRQLLM